MADNNRISIKKTSRVLAITCVAYTTVATILYNNYQIDLIDYSTPVILGTVATIMSCAALQRLFCSLLSKSYLSFGCKELSSRRAVPSETNPDTQEELPHTDNATSEKQVKSPYLKEYEARIEELRRNEMEKKTATVHAIHEYTEVSTLLILNKMSSIYASNRSLPNALYCIMPMYIEAGLINRPKTGIYTKVDYEGVSTFARKLYIKSFLVHNDLIQEEDIDSLEHPYFEFIL